MLDWLGEHEPLLWWIGSASLAVLIGALIAIPILIACIPQDYFTKRRRPRHDESKRSLLRLTVAGIKNVIGGILILAGLAMLVLPGQGILTILIGLMLMNYPGKYRLEKWIVKRPGVLRAINWIRKKAHKPPLKAG